MKLNVAFAVALAALVSGCGNQQQAPNRANRAPQGFQAQPQGKGPNSSQAGHKYGAKPGLREYRVHSELVLDLGKGTQGSVNGGTEKCVNGNGGFAFTTAGPPEKRDLWIDASESVFPPCYQNPSWQYFTINVSSPYKGKYADVYLGQGQAGQPYILRCSRPGEGVKSRLDCKQNGDKSVTIYCTPPLAVDQKPCASGAASTRSRTKGR
jgi:hypothetical protein